MDITIKITDQDNIVYENVITLTEKFQSQSPELGRVVYLFSGAALAIESHLHTKFSTGNAPH